MASAVTSSTNTTENVYFPQLTILQTGFEGCEKRLLVEFTGSGNLRSVPEETWRQILTHANCSILSTKSNEFFTAFLLSESSLFVYPDTVIVKTCGTTTLLKIIPPLLEAAKTVGCAQKHVRYSRSHFMFPDLQVYPHKSFMMELCYLGRVFDGRGYVLGPKLQTWHEKPFEQPFNWHVYTSGTPHSRAGVTLEIVLFELDRSVMKIFTQRFANGDACKCTTAAGIHKLLPRNAIVDEYLFEPCGYSLNALAGTQYCTIHITPEPKCSFVSFETNLAPGQDYTKLVSSVVSVFKPQRFCVALCSQRANPEPKKKGCFSNCSKNDVRFDGFERMLDVSQELDNDKLKLSMQTFRKQSPPKSPVIFV